MSKCPEYPKHACCAGGWDCCDLPVKPGPCNDWKPCDCDFPSVEDHEHCDNCQHAIACHQGPFNPRHAEGGTSAGHLRQGDSVLIPATVQYVEENGLYVMVGIPMHGFSFAEDKTWILPVAVDPAVLKTVNP